MHDGSESRAGCGWWGMIDRASRRRIHVAWKNMKQRCSNPSREDFKWYGARGITVCPEWADSFPAFLSWAICNGYEDHLTLERVDSDGPYCPENCRWATKKEQANNRRTNRRLTINGRTQSIAEWSQELGIDRSTLWRRINAGWTVERALTEPVHIEKRKRSVRS